MRRATSPYRRSGCEFSSGAAGGRMKRAKVLRTLRRGRDGGTGERSDKARAARFTRAKTTLYAYARASLRPRPDSMSQSHQSQSWLP